MLYSADTNPAAAEIETRGKWEEGGTLFLTQTKMTVQMHLNLPCYLSYSEKQKSPLPTKNLNASSLKGLL